jgi:hypothetical protein
MTNLPKIKILAADSRLSKVVNSFRVAGSVKRS